MSQQLQQEHITSNGNEDLEETQSDYRAGHLAVEEWPISRQVSSSPIQLSQQHQQQQQQKQMEETIVPFMSGNTEIHTGILHLYRDIEPTPILQLPTVLCVLAVPSFMTAADFLHFIGSSRQRDISHFRILRERSKFMVILKFRNSKSANEFYHDFNGRPFSSMGSEICRVVHVKSIQCQLPMPGFTTQECNGGILNMDGEEEQNIMVELPTCPVCLERMDASVSGLLTILCHHTFHCKCLSKWEDTTCPVCRFQPPITSQPAILSNSPATPIEETDDISVCAMCSSTQNLWVCLICGHLGCGRYQQAHAYAHYLETSHLYAMDLESQRVWDYAGDGYVHRLIQNKSDGKLVEFPSRAQGCSTGKIPSEKLDDLSLEFTHILTSSLEAQRTHFETQLNSATEELAYYQNEWHCIDKKYRECHAVTVKLQDRNDALEELCQKQSNQIQEFDSSCKSTQILCGKLASRLKEVTLKLEEEEAISKQLLSNQPSYVSKIESLERRLEEKDRQIEDLQEQVRDLMVFLDAKEKIQTVTDESIVEGTLKISAPSTPSSSSSKKKRRNQPGKR